MLIKRYMKKEQDQNTLYFYDVPPECFKTSQLDK